jgi:hypothetical protein
VVRPSPRSLKERFDEAQRDADLIVRPESGGETLPLPCGPKRSGKRWTSGTWLEGYASLAPLSSSSTPTEIHLPLPFPSLPFSFASLTPLPLLAPNPPTPSSTSSMSPTRTASGLNKKPSSPSMQPRPNSLNRRSSPSLRGRMEGRRGRRPRPRIGGLEVG